MDSTLTQILIAKHIVPVFILPALWSMRRKYVSSWNWENSMSHGVSGGSSVPLSCLHNDWGACKFPLWLVLETEVLLISWRSFLCAFVQEYYITHLHYIKNSFEGSAETRKCFPTHWEHETGTLLCGLSGALAGYKAADVEYTSGYSLQGYSNANLPPTWDH